MNIKPILFNTDMVRAILDGRKTVTRRVIKPQPDQETQIWMVGQDKALLGASTCPFGAPGDILYVRETWQYAYDMDGNDQIIEGTGRYLYYSENPMPFNDWIDPDTGEHKEHMPWKPSIHMPKEAARIWLKVTNVRVERLKDITTEEALKEGCTGEPCDYVNQGAFGCTDCYNTGWLYPPEAEFVELWNSTIKKQDLNTYGWDANPWVWVIEFERCEKPEEVE